MSKPRYDWWGYAKAIIRRYPTLRAELQERQLPRNGNRLQWDAAWRRRST